MKVDSWCLPLEQYFSSPMNNLEIAAAGLEVAWSRNCTKEGYFARCTQALMVAFCWLSVESLEFMMNWNV